MPKNDDFIVEIMIAGVVVPEYERDGQFYVECNLNTPFTYKEKSAEVINGEREEQEYPVTPYQIKLTALSGKQFPNYYRLKVDGIKVKGLSLNSGESRIIKGFRDGTSVRELLYSMPRFARDADDRVNVERRRSIGCIEIECWMATLQTRRTEMRVNNLDFQQANKKDSNNVTNGNYMMATSRVGKVVCQRSFVRNVDSWKLVSLLSNLTIHYRMAESLRDLGFTLRAPKFQASSALSRPSTRRRRVKDEPSESHARKKAKRARNKPENQEEAAKTLPRQINRLELKKRGAEPQPSTSAADTELINLDDDDIELVDEIPPSVTGNKPAKSATDMVDLTEDIADIEFADSVGTTSNNTQVRVKEEGPKEDTHNSKHSDPKESNSNGQDGEKESNSKNQGGEKEANSKNQGGEKESNSKDQGGEKESNSKDQSSEKESNSKDEGSEKESTSKDKDGESNVKNTSDTEVQDSQKEVTDSSELVKVVETGERQKVSETGDCTTPGKETANLAKSSNSGDAAVASEATVDSTSKDNLTNSTTPSGSGDHSSSNTNVNNAEVVAKQ